jgi:hypothetical protein
MPGFLAMHRLAPRVALFVATVIPVAAPGFAQTGVTIRISRPAPVLETPRGDSLIVGSLTVGTVMPVLERVGYWYRIDPPKDAKADWLRGWVHARYTEIASGTFGPPAGANRTPGRMTYRGFVRGGMAMFGARNSFETVLDGRFGPVFGGGAQVGFPNGTFAQVGFSRFEKTGARVIVSASQVFRLDVPYTVTITPIEASVGYREINTNGTASYVGFGVGYHQLVESTPSFQDRTTTAHIGYQVFGGVEYPVGRWLSVAGEVQWAGLPKSLGESGVSEVFEEDDLGGATFVVKLLVGR